MRSRRLSCVTFCTMTFMRLLCSSMILTRRFSSAFSKFMVSPRSCAALESAPRGLRISWAMLAAGRAIAQPLEQLNGEIRRNLIEGKFFLGLIMNAEIFLRGLVDQAYVSLRVTYYNTGLHALDDELIELREIGDIHTAALGQLFGGAQTGGEQIAKKGRGVETDPEQPYLRKSLQHLGICWVATGQHAPRVFEQHGDGGQ